MDIFPPTPRIVQPGVLPLRVWREEYEYHVDCIMSCLQTRLQGTSSYVRWDWDGVRRDLERHLHATGANRFKKYRAVQ